MKPMIGINLDIKDGPPREAAILADYFDAVQKSGGIPVLLPPMPEDDTAQVLEMLDGIMLIGGRDYNAKLWGEENCALARPLSTEREQFDLRLIQRILSSTDIPVLGICAGAQLMNIGLGGSMIQDIPTEMPTSPVDHANTGGTNRHAVTLLESSKLFDIYSQKKFSVPTSHHQAVRKLGKGLTASAYAEDDIIEAVEMASKPFVIGVQWHPERDYNGNKNLFVQFVKAASQRAVRCGRK